MIFLENRVQLECYLCISGRKKKAAPPPPPTLKSSTSVADLSTTAATPSPVVVASQPLPVISQQEGKQLDSYKISYNHLRQYSKAKKDGINITNRFFDKINSYFDNNVSVVKNTNTLGQIYHVQNSQISCYPEDNIDVGSSRLESCCKQQNSDYLPKNSSSTESFNVHTKSEINFHTIQRNTDNWKQFLTKLDKIIVHKASEIY